MLGESKQYSTRNWRLVGAVSVRSHPLEVWTGEINIPVVRAPLLLLIPIRLIASIIITHGRASAQTYSHDMLR